MDPKRLEWARSVVSRWIPPITANDKRTLMSVFSGPNVGFGIPLIREYIRFLRPYTTILGLSGPENKPREDDCAASGLVFFYGCLFYSMHFPNWGQHIRSIFLYNLLYITVDHLIDDTTMTEDEKRTMIAQMKILIVNPSAHVDMKLIDPVLKIVAITYQELLTHCPGIKETIFKLLEAEIDGLRIQKDGKSSRDDYYNIALRKGGYTMAVVQKILGNDCPQIAKISYHIGTIMQLIDDSVDVLADREKGIHTIATYDLARGTLDNLWFDIVERIEQLPSTFPIYSIIYTAFTVYLPDRIREAYSDRLRAMTNPLNLYDYNYGCDGSGLLIETIRHEIDALETLEEYRKLSSNDSHFPN